MVSTKRWPRWAPADTGEGRTGYSLFGARDGRPPAFHRDVALRSLNDVWPGRAHLEWAQGEIPRKAQLEKPRRNVLKMQISGPKTNAEEFSQHRFKGSAYRGDTPLNLQPTRELEFCGPLKGERLF